MSASAAPILWTADAAAQATRGRATAPFAATGLSIDSRSLQPGDLFVAIRGPNVDGHDYLDAAFAAGSAAAMVDREPAATDGKRPLLVVADTFAGLKDLAVAARNRGHVRVVAVTGSVGKTGTKDALQLVLSRQGKTAATIGNLNNHWGLPLSLARMPEDARFGVFEMGMNHPGEIEPLSRLARPHVAVITTVEAVHSAHFTGVEQIADAKAEIFAGMRPGGVAVLNRDNPLYGRLVDVAHRQGISDILAFGRHTRAEIRLRDAEAEDGGAGSRVTAEILGHALRYRVGISGGHWVMNSLAVLGAALALGADPFAAAEALADLRAPRGRGRMHQIAIPGGAFRLIDESYNASPVSMRAAFDVLARIEPEAGGRRIAVLGDMLELGPETPDLHAGLATPLLDAGIDLVFTAGTAMANLWDELPAEARGGHAATADKLAAMVAGAVRPGDVLTIKGSAGSRMGVIVETLLALDGGNGQPAAKRAANGA